MKRQWIFFVGEMAALALCLGHLYCNFDRLFENPVESRYRFDYPVCASKDNAGNIFIVDSSRRRVSQVGVNGTIRYSLTGGSRSIGKFFYANEIVPDPAGNLYLLNIVNDENGFYCIREEIQRFDANGRYRQTLYSRVYDKAKDRIPSLVQRGRIFSLSASSETLRWFLVDETGIQPMECDLRSGSLKEGKLYRLQNAIYDIAHVAYNPRGGFGYSTKNGRIVAVNGGIETLLYTAPQNAFEIVPWEIGFNRDGTVYFIDLQTRTIRRIVSPDSAIVALSSDIIRSAGFKTANDVFYRFSVLNDGTLITTNSEAVIVCNPEKKELVYRSDARNGLRRTALIILAWASAAAALLLLVALSRFMYAVFMRSSSSKVLKKAFVIIVIVGISAVVVTDAIIPNMGGRYQNVVLERIGLMLQLLPRGIDGNRIAAIRTLADYDKDDYRSIRESFLKALNHNRDPWNACYYFAVYKVADGALYEMMQLNGALGMHYPYDWLGDGGVYDRALQGKIATEIKEDISGYWIYGVGPIYGSDGKVVALLETGTDMYSFQLANQALVRNIIFDMITALVVLVLSMIEMAFLVDLFQKRRPIALVNALTDAGEKLPDDAGLPEDYSDAFFGRPISFLLFAGISMSLAFIPLLSQNFHFNLSGFSAETITALPLSVETFGFGLATIFIGMMTRRLGWRIFFALGAVIACGGLFLSATASDWNAFVIARGCTGIGSGMAYIGLRSFINREGRAAQKTSAYSYMYAGMTAGVNVGVIFGAALADRIGYARVFYCGIVLIALALVFFIAFLRKTPFLGLDPAPAVKLGIFKMLRFFLKSGRLWLFFLTIVLPTYLAGTFLGYYFPLFAKSQGISTADIGRLWILNGLFIIYLGPALSAVVKRLIGDWRATILTSMLWGASLVFFGLTCNVWGLVIVLIVMGITEGFGVVMQNSVYLNFEVSRRIGEDRAVSYFELYGKIGETVGPIVFSLALALGESLGHIVMGIGVALVAVPFAFLAPKRARIESVKEPVHV
jgi:MFS family permease